MVFSPTCMSFLNFLQENSIVLRVDSLEDYNGNVKENIFFEKIADITV